MIGAAVGGVVGVGGLLSPMRMKHPRIGDASKPSEEPELDLARLSVSATVHCSHPQSQPSGVPYERESGRHRTCTTRNKDTCRRHCTGKLPARVVDGVARFAVNPQSSRRTGHSRHSAVHSPPCAFAARASRANTYH